MKPDLRVISNDNGEAQNKTAPPRLDEFSFVHGGDYMFIYRNGELLDPLSAIDEITTLIRRGMEIEAKRLGLDPRVAQPQSDGGA